MTSLEETLPILDRAVPALPGKVEAVADKAAALQQAVAEAVALMERKAVEVEALGRRVEQAMQTLRAQELAHLPELTASAVGVRLAADEERDGMALELHDLRRACDQTEAASGDLATALGEIGGRLEAAHDDASSAVLELSERVGLGAGAMESAGEALLAASAAGRQAFEEGRRRVTAGATTLKDAVVRLLGEAQARLQQTERVLDEVRSGQERAVSAAGETLDAGRQAVEAALQEGLREAVPEALDPPLASGEGALQALGTKVLAFEVEAEAAREALATELAAVTGRLPRLRDGAVKVREAAAQVGIAWP